MHPLSQKCSAGLFKSNRRMQAAMSWRAGRAHAPNLQPKPRCAMSMFTVHGTSQAGTNSTTSTNHEGGTNSMFLNPSTFTTPGAGAPGRGTSKKTSTGNHFLEITREFAEIIAGTRRQAE